MNNEPNFELVKIKVSLVRLAKKTFDMNDILSRETWLSNNKRRHTGGEILLIKKHRAEMELVQIQYNTNDIDLCTELSMQQFLAIK